MKSMTESQIRDAMANAPDDEAARMPVPGLHEVIWDQREYLGWRDPQAAHRGYIAFWRGEEPVVIALRAAESRLSAGSAMCSLCQTHQPAGQVLLFTAPLAGKAGEAGNSVGTYICADLACSILIRIGPPRTEFQPDPDGLIARKAAGLSERLALFGARVLADAA